MIDCCFDWIPQTAYQKSNRPRVQGEFAGRQVPGSEATVSAPARETGSHQTARVGMGHDSNWPLLTPLVYRPCLFFIDGDLVNPAPYPPSLIMIPIENYFFSLSPSLLLHSKFFQKEFIFFPYTISLKRPWLNRLSVKKLCSYLRQEKREKLAEILFAHYHLVMGEVALSLSLLSFIFCCCCLWFAGGAVHSVMKSFPCFLTDSQNSKSSRQPRKNFLHFFFLQKNYKYPRCARKMQWGKGVFGVCVCACVASNENTHLTVGRILLI